MAEEKKTTTTAKKTAPKKTTSTKSDDSLKKELEAQKKQNDELKTKLDELMALMASQKLESVATIDEDDDNDVLVISLMPCKLNLISEDGGAAYTFDKMYEEHARNRYEIEKERWNEDIENEMDKIYTSTISHDLE